MDSELLNSITADIGVLANDVEQLCAVKDYSLQEWMDSQEACELLNVTKRTLQTYRDTGRLPFSRIERKVYYKSQDVLRLLETTKEISSNE